MRAGEPGALPAELLGEPVVHAERCRWGFTNYTSLVTLASGRRVIAQRVSPPERAAAVARITSELPPILRAAGIAAPPLLAADMAARPPLLVRAFIPGDTASAMLADQAGADRLASQMGALLAHLASAPADMPWLDRTWADPASLASAAAVWLRRSSAALGDREAAALAATTASLAETWQPGEGLAHGDFCPVNAIAAGGGVIALVDWEMARVGSPWFDAAWWGWVVRFHHPERWVTAWPRLLAAAGLEATDAACRHVAALQRLRCLELLAEACAAGPAQAAHWTARVSQTLMWEHVKSSS